jgi:hypothetical protein
MKEVAAKALLTGDSAKMSDETKQQLTTARNYNENGSERE